MSELHYVRRRDNRAMWSAVERFLITRDGAGCFYCGRSHYTLDHVTPRYRGGSDSPDNLVLSCVECNWRKSTSLGWLFVIREWARSDSNALSAEATGLQPAPALQLRRSPEADKSSERICVAA